MGEVLCVANWSEQKERQLTAWVKARSDRYVVWVVDEEIKKHPRMYQLSDNDLSFRQVATELIYLPFIYEDPSHPALQRLARIQSEIHLRASDFIDQGVKLLENYRANLQQSFWLADDCFGQFSHYPAVVCGAGPSLKEAIPFLKEHRSRFLIVGCGAGMQALIAAGVEPHFSLHVDADPDHRFLPSKIPLLFQLRTSAEVVSKMQGLRLMMAGAGDFPLERWIEEKLGMEPRLDGGWTAATKGVALAEALGCKTICLAGMDFSVSSGSVYAKGVKDSKKTELVSITLNDGTRLQTRPDWLLAAEWLNAWALSHPEVKWGIVSQTNRLMPAIGAVDLREVMGPEDVSSTVENLLASCKLKEGKAIWEEVAASFASCRILAEQFLTTLQAIFPQPPSEDQRCLNILHDLEKELVVQTVLEPIWEHWEQVLKRQSENHPDALIVHRLLLLKSLADHFHV